MLLFLVQYVSLFCLYWNCMFKTFDLNSTMSSCCPLKITEKGLEYQDRLLRGKCTQAFKSANEIANQIHPYLEHVQAEDFGHVRQLSLKLNQYVESIVETKEQYHEIFAGNLSHIAEFDFWFQARFTALQELQDLVCVYLETQADDLLKPEDSVSQAFQPSRRTHRSRSSKHRCSYTSSHKSTVSSTRVKESLNKAALLAEAKHLSEKQKLRRQELELSIAKQSLELNAKLSISTAKEHVLGEFEAGSSLLSVSRVVKSEPGMDTISPSITSRQSVKQVENTPMYTSSFSHHPVHPSVSTVSYLGSTSCPSVTVPLSADTVSLTAATGTTVHPSVSTVSNLVSLTTATGTIVHQSVSTVSNLGSTSCPSITVPRSTDTASFTTTVGTPLNVSVSTCSFPGSTSFQFDTVRPSTDSVCQSSAISHLVNWSVNSVPLHGCTNGSPAGHLPCDTYFRGVDVSSNFVSPSVTTLLSHMLNNVCVSNLVGMFVDNGGTLMSVPRGSLCVTGNSVCMPTGVYLPSETGTSHYRVTSTLVTTRYRGDSRLDPSSPEFVPAEVGPSQVHGAGKSVHFVRSDIGSDAHDEWSQDPKFNAVFDRLTNVLNDQRYRLPEILCPNSVVTHSSMQGLFGLLTLV